jgi:nucleoid DNA-binding protein
MPAELKEAIKEAKKNNFALIGNELSDDDVCRIWENVSSFIEKQMLLNKGVNIPGLGSFTFSQKNLEIGHNKTLHIQRPVFMISEKFAQVHQLQSTKHHVTGQIPVVPLNFASVANESPFNRDVTESCVKEVIQALSRSVASKRNVEFTFQGIGKLQIRDCKVKFRFYKEFLNVMDGSGQLVNALMDRPGTVDSVMSDRPPTRAHSVNTMLFPKMSSQGSNNDMMPPIKEEGDDDNKDEKPMIDSRERDIGKEMNTFDPDHREEDEKIRSKHGSRMSIPLATATGISFNDDLVPAALMTPNRGRRSLSPLGFNTPRPPKLDRARTMDDVALKRPSPLPKVPSPPTEPRAVSADSGCGHVNAGQELCYLCHQRERRNIPVSFTEERKRRENEEDKLLQEYNHMKDTEHLLKENEKHLAKRHELQKMAAFNLGVSDAVKAKKGSRETQFFPSYVFQRRPLTPPRFIKQEKYFNALKEQVDFKDEKEKKQKADNDFLERLEQVQLAEDLALQRDEYVNGKIDQVNQYKTALDAQVMYLNNISLIKVCYRYNGHSLFYVVIRQLKYSRYMYI